MLEESEIIEAIQKSLEGARVEISCPRGDGRHFDAVVAAKQFVGKTLVEQHQMVMGPLKELFEGKLHALSLRTIALEEGK